jgi:hypothetical protein
MPKKKMLRKKRAFLFLRKRQNPFSSITGPGHQFPMADGLLGLMGCDQGKETPPAGVTVRQLRDH